MHSNLNITKIINHLSSLTNFASQVIPIYTKAKPVLSNAKDALKKAQGLLSKTNSNSKVEKEIKKEETVKHYSNAPRFFL